MSRRSKVFFGLLICCGFMSSCFCGCVFAQDGTLNNLIAKSNLTDNELGIYAQNNIYFVYDDCTSSGGSSSLCGDTATEIYWSAVSQHMDDPIKIAGVMGNLANEGGMNPVAWEGSITNSDGTLMYSWDYIYGGGLDGKKGVGAFGITSGLSKYLRYINDNAPDLIKYFKDSVEYGFNYVYTGGGPSPTYGDTLLKKIGKEEFGKLVEIEMNYAMGEFNPSTTNDYLGRSFSSPAEAASWWMTYWERPNAKYAHEDRRRADAEKFYVEYGKDYKCSVSSTSTPSGSNSSGISPSVNGGVTLIGDSISVQSEKELQEKLPGAFMSKVGSRHSDSGGMCEGDNGGLNTLKTIASGSGTVKDQHASGDCHNQNVDSSSLKENVVWGLGANAGGANRATLDEVIRIVGKNRKLFLVTPYNNVPGSKAGEISELYRKVADENDNVYVVDWNKAVSANESQYVVDEGYAVVHPTEAGRKLLADLITEAIGSTANCAMAITYKDSEYTKRLDGLDTFNQGSGTFKDEQMCPGEGWRISGAGCGLMSLFAAYYMFTGDGMNNSQVFNDIRAAALDDDFIPGCNGGSEPNNRKTDAIEKYTGIKIENGHANGGRINEYGEEYYSDSDWGTFVDELKKGKKAIIEVSGKGGTNFTSPTGYHYMMVDHYNADKDAIFLFDPSMYQGKVDASGVVAGPTGEIKDGVYVSRKQMEKAVIPHGWWWLNYYGQACEVMCEEGTDGGLKAGGMTKEEAEKFIEPYIKEATKINGAGVRGAYGKGYDNGDVIGDGWVHDAGCDNGTLNNCSAFSQWFVNNYTSAGPRETSWMGYAFAEGLVNTAKGFKYGGTTPRPYAIFSTTGGYNHTGVVLGVDEKNGLVYTGEAHCDTSFGAPRVHTHSMAEATSGLYIYAYTDDVLKTELFSK